MDIHLNLIWNIFSKHLVEIVRKRDQRVQKYMDEVKKQEEEKLNKEKEIKLQQKQQKLELRKQIEQEENAEELEALRQQFDTSENGEGEEEERKIFLCALCNKQFKSEKQ